MLHSIISEQEHANITIAVHSNVELYANPPQTSFSSRLECKEQADRPITALHSSPTALFLASFSSRCVCVEGWGYSLISLPLMLAGARYTVTLTRSIQVCTAYDSRQWVGGQFLILLGQDWFSQRSTEGKIQQCWYNEQIIITSAMWLIHSFAERDQDNLHFDPLNKGMFHKRFITWSCEVPWRLNSHFKHFFTCIYLTVTSIQSDIHCIQEIKPWPCHSTKSLCASCDNVSFGATCLLI